MTGTRLCAVSILGLSKSNGRVQDIHWLDFFEAASREDVEQEARSQFSAQHPGAEIRSCLVDPVPGGKRRG